MTRILILLALGQIPEGGNNGIFEPVHPAATPLHHNDDIKDSFGNTAAAPDCSWEWDTGATPNNLRLTCTDIDGIGTDGVVCYVDAGTRIWHCLGGLTINGALTGVSSLDSTTEATIEAAIDTLANLTSIQSQSVTLAGELHVEAATHVNQDLTSDASPSFATVKLIGLSDDYIPYHVNDGTGLANGPTKTNVDSAIALKHYSD